MSDNSHAIANAKAWLDTITEMVAAMVAADPKDDAAQDAAREAVETSPLSVQVRSGWHTPGAAPEPAGEFEILLSTGGPALRIVGDLNEYAEPDAVNLQWQDWGTPWTPYALDGAESETVLAFAQCFYFGEG